MTAHDSALPDDVDALKAMVRAMAEKTALLEQRNAHLEQVNQGAEERIARLMAIVKMLERARYGTRSERLGKDRLSGRPVCPCARRDRDRCGGPRGREGEGDGTLDDQAPAAPAQRLCGASRTGRGGDRAGRCSGLRGVGADPDRRGCLRAAGCDAGEVPGHRHAPAQIRLQGPRRRHPGGSSGPDHRQRHSHRGAAGPDRRVEIRRWPAAVPPGSDLCPRPGSSSSARRWRSGWARSASSSSPWPSTPWQRIKQGERIFADETTLPTLAPGAGKAKTAYLWAYVRDDRPFGGSDPPIVVYRFEDSRAGDCVARHLEGYRGILQVDGYTAYHRLARPEGANEGVTAGGLLVACAKEILRAARLGCLRRGRADAGADGVALGSWRRAVRGQGCGTPEGRRGRRHRRLS